MNEAVPDDGCVLIIVDMQNGFLSADTRHVVPAVKSLARQWLSAGRPVVLTRYFNYPGSPYEKLLHWYKLRTEDETELTPELDEIAAQANAIIDKTGYTAFTPVLDKLIAENGWNSVLLCGLDTETCVLKSAADAFERGLTPWVAGDACASNGGEQFHEEGLRIIGRLISRNQVLTTAEI
jgi:nicotinamidase-related amidase